MRTAAVFALTSLASLATSLLAQEQYGAIFGTIRDSSEAVVPGATLEVSSPALVGGASTTSNENGEYVFRGLASGEYEVTATLAGFTPVRVGGVLITLGKTLRVDMTLQPGAVSETVTVTGEAPLIDVTASAVSQSLPREEFERLPIGRDYTSVATLTPGANPEAKLGGISIDGASSAENVYFVDGMDVSSIQRGVSAKTVIVDLIDEVQVKSSGYNAEYGGALGGVINVTTRSGANQFRGEANLYVRGSALTASPNPTLRLGVTDSTIAETATYAEDSRTLFEPGFMLGGYLIRDRLWFYASYFPEIEDTERGLTFRTNGQTGSFTEDKRTHYVVGKLTGQITDRMRGNFSVNLGPGTTDGRLPAIDGTSNPDFPFAELGLKSSNRLFAGDVDFVATNNLYLSFRGGYFGYDFHDVNAPNELMWMFGDSNLLTPGIPDDLRRPTGWSNIPTNSATTKDLQSRLFFGADATYQLDAGGRHTFKGGIQFTRLGNDLQSGDLQNRVSLFWDRAYTARSTGLRYEGPFGYYSYVQNQSLGDVHSDGLALFVQDSWQIKNLTLNLGLRVEREDVPSYLPIDAGFPETAIHFDFGDKIAPRLGAVYDVLGDARWKMYGGYGKFYDVMKLELPRGLFGASRRLTYFHTLDTFDWPSIGVNDNFPGQFIEVVNGRPSAIERGWLDPDIKPVQSEEFSLGLERELNARTALGVRYIRKRLVRTIEDTGFVGPTGSTEYVIGNPGFGQTVRILERSRNQGGFPPGYAVPELPKARRDYDAVELRVTKRLSNRWLGNFSYIWSRLFGNYTGLVAADELNLSTGIGRLSPNVSSAYDQPYNVHDAESGQPLYRHLPTDRPHQIKSQVAYLFDWGLTVGANVYVASGTPVLQSVFKTNDIFFGGDLSMGRTPVLSQTDLTVQHEFRLGDNKRLAVGLNILNLFDQRAVTATFFRVNRDGISFTDPEFFEGRLDVDQKIDVLQLRRDPRFGMPFAWQDPLSARVNVRFLF